MRADIAVITSSDIDQWDQIAAAVNCVKGYSVISRDTIDDCSDIEADLLVTTENIMSSTAKCVVQMRPEYADHAIVVDGCIYHRPATLLHLIKIVQRLADKHCKGGLK